MVGIAASSYAKLPAKFQGISAAGYLVARNFPGRLSGGNEADTAKRVSAMIEHFKSKQ